MKDSKAIARLVVGSLIVSTSSGESGKITVPLFHKKTVLMEGTEKVSIMV